MTAIDDDEVSQTLSLEDYIAQLAVKFVIPNVAVGSIIGKGGSNISLIQTQSQARIQLSKIGETWPGAGLGGLEGGAPLPGPDRILLISGSLDSLLTALHAVLTAFRAAPSALAAVSGREDGTMCLRLLVHARLCGTLIGRGGATIRSFKEASGAVFNISPAPGPGEPPERVVRVTGQPDELLKAVALVLTKLSQNPDYAALTDTHDRVGMVIGRAGSVVNQLKAVLGVRIHISPRGDYLPGTLLRRCEIIGPPENVTLARHVIEQKVKGGQE
ncbi:hypothetical protein QBZ16_005391 [Prototheca wickerhamii]|uniref:K Homology domain-containing protein n=1 Tax=Prototheca wickerhamii TaxID=3111 RepID=A0AAD9IFJ6_PROWI|nr:hypothetical protein QBZ16_005391 [Prototheca wickerhamii]